MHSHPLNLNVMRKYIGGIDLIRTKLPKYIVCFLSLWLLVIQEENLKHMFSGAESSSSTYFRRSDSQAVKSFLYPVWRKLEKYMPVSEIIDRRWNTQLHSPLYAAAFLNPSIIR